MSRWSVEQEDIKLGTQYGDTLSTPSGIDRSFWLDGREGDDSIASGPEDDILSGGRGFDTFYFSIGDGIDVITDYQPGIDQFDLTEATRKLEFTDYAHGVLVDYGSGGFFLLGADEVNIYDFIF